MSMKTVKHITQAGFLLLSHLIIVNSALATSNYNNDPEYQNANQENKAQSYSSQLSEAELAQILAPIALYPDSLLTHIIIASTYPLELVQAQRWRERNQHLDPASAVEEAEKQGWDPSVTALVAFDSVLERLNEDLQWTQDLGDAFLEDEERVLASIQTLRQQAERANSLNNLTNLTVTKVNRQIIIEPVHKEIIYVPYYDTRIVYGNWHWRKHPPIFWAHSPHFSVHFPGRISGHFSWNAGVNINFNYFFSSFNWHRRHVVVTHHHRTNYYRTHSRIATSHGAKRWQHKPVHRRGVEYRSQKAKTRFYNNKQIRHYAKSQNQYKHEHFTVNRKAQRKAYSEHKAYRKTYDQASVDRHYRNKQSEKRVHVQKRDIVKSEQLRTRNTFQQRSKKERVQDKQSRQHGVHERKANKRVQNERKPSKSKSKVNKRAKTQATKREKKRER